MSAPTVHIPSPRRPLGAAPAAPSVPAPRAGLDGRADRTEGRHRRREDHVDVPAPRRERPRSTSPQVPGIPAPRPAAPGSSARRPAQDRTAVPAPRPATAPAVPAQHPADVPARHRPATAPAPRPTGDVAARGRTGAGQDRPQHAVVAGRGGRPSATARTLDLLGRIGSVTTIAAMLVLSAALAGLTDGTPPTGAAAEVAVTTLR